MKLKEIIYNRTSVRIYKDKEVPQSLISEILENGNLAPTAGNIQPWEFIIIKEDNKKKEIVNTTFVGANMNSPKTQKWMLSAPVFIAICGDKEKMYNRYGKNGVDTLLYLDCSACIENMLLTAVDLGLASCYVSGFRIDELSNVLELPPHIIPIAILPIGYSGIDEIKRRKKEDVESKIHYETYKI
ncbi:MAG TPA: nitroreductase family protein [Thermoanaerobacterales bacterium]|nr:nitroreductase family protein [Thermoanaerobacterales bacterium]